MLVRQLESMQEDRRRQENAAGGGQTLLSKKQAWDKKVRILDELRERKAKTTSI